MFLASCIQNHEGDQESFLADACDAERLTREPRKQHVVAWYVFSWEWDNIAHERMVVTVVVDVGLFREVVPFAGKDAFSPVGLEPHPDTADASEKVNNSKVLFRRCQRRCRGIQHFP